MQNVCSKCVFALDEKVGCVNSLINTQSQIQNLNHVKKLLNSCNFNNELNLEKAEAIKALVEVYEGTNINKASHYQGKIECIDYIEDKLGKEKTEGFCIGNVIKYISRYEKKNGTEDLKKALYYLKKAIKIREEGEKIE